MEIMCWKKIINWWNNLQESNPDPPPPNPEPGAQKSIAIIAAINNYPGSSNDLQGCLNDLGRISYMLPDFEKRLLKDSQVTNNNFKNEILKAAEETINGDIVIIAYSGHGTYTPDYNGDEVDGKDEALYLYDGVLLDDTFGQLLSNFKDGVKVIIFLDSCFSESATRALNIAPNKNKGRFRVYKKFRTGKRLPRKRFLKNPIREVVFSGCSEHETSADAFIDGKFNGAFTYYLWTCMDRNLTYREWYNECRKYLPSQEYNQTPTLEGPEEILNQRLFT